MATTRKSPHDDQETPQTEPPGESANHPSSGDQPIAAPPRSNQVGGIAGNEPDDQDALGKLDRALDSEP